jgi:hypothetical protein
VRFSNGSAQHKSCSTWRLVARTLILPIWSWSRLMGDRSMRCLVRADPAHHIEASLGSVETTGALLLVDCSCSILF